jgi:hypothetical protein
MPGEMELCRAFLRPLCDASRPLPPVAARRLLKNSLDGTNFRFPNAKDLVGWSVRTTRDSGVSTPVGRGADLRES